MKRYGILGLAILITGAIVAGFVANTGAAFNPNRLIDDGIMNNSGAMSAAQIDAFLNARQYSCISPNSGFEARVPSGYSPSGGFTFGGFGTAGQVIAAAAQAYDLNPQVLIVTLEKEQSLVTGRNSSTYCFGTEHKYAAAVGYGCPDSGGSYTWSGISLYRRNGTEVTSVAGTCVNSAAKAGFSQQIIRAAWLLKFSQQRSLGNVGWAIIRGSWDNSDDLNSCYAGPMTEGTWKVCPHGTATFYDGYRTIDSQAVHMDTGGTAALYWYTPHLHGNELFVDIFTNWFGSPVLPIYSWQPIHQTVYTDSTKSKVIGWNATLLTGQTAYVKLTVKNTGNVAWEKNSANPVRLGTWWPTDRISEFAYAAGWLGANRVGTPKEDVVEPGEMATFEFNVRAPNRAGTYLERFNLVAEGKTWFADQGLLVVFDVRPATYTWAPVHQTIFTDNTKTVPLGWNATTMPGQKVYAAVTVKNTGNVAWEKNSANPVRLGTWWPTDRISEFAYAAGWLGANRVGTPKEDVVEPGGLATFEFWMQTPNRAGKFMEQFNLVAEGLAWMPSNGLLIVIDSANHNYSWSPVHQTVFTDSTKTSVIGWHATINTGQTAYVVIKAKNTGNVAWYKDNPLGPKINLATSGPVDRDSPLCTAAWISCKRIVTHTESVVPPGGIATFEFPVQAPAQTGVFYEQYNLIAEGKTWLPNAGLLVIFTVQ